VHESLNGFAWVIIPVVAILAGTVRTWIRVQASQRRLGVSTNELEAEVAALQKAKQELTDRVQNLETIVVSQTWGVLQDRTLSSPERDLKLGAATRHEVAPHDHGDENQRRAEQLASRLR
jgi:hypothetical protein